MALTKAYDAPTASTVFESSAEVAKRSGRSIGDLTTKVQVKFSFHVNQKDPKSIVLYFYRTAREFSWSFNKEGYIGSNFGSLKLSTKLIHSKKTPTLFNVVQKQELVAAVISLDEAKLLSTSMDSECRVGDSEFIFPSKLAIDLRSMFAQI